MSKLRSDELVNMEGDGAPSFPQGATSIEPTADNQVATKLYVDSALSAASGNAVSATAPINPAVGSFWTDTSVSPSLLKTWNGSMWIEFAGEGVGYTGSIGSPVEVLTPLDGAGVGGAYTFTPQTDDITDITEILDNGYSPAFSARGAGGNDANGMAYGNGVYVIIGEDRPTVYSTDEGRTWTSAAGWVGGGSWKALTWNGSVFCAVGNSAEKIATSADGNTWTSPSSKPNCNFKCVTSDPATGQIVAGGNTGIYYSTDDGASWAKCAITNDGNADIIGIVYGGGRYVATSSDNRFSPAYSTNGTYYTYPQTRLIPDGASWKGPIYDPDSGLFSVYWADGQDYNMYVYTSSNGSSWTSYSRHIGRDRIEWIEYGNGTYCIIPYYKNYYRTTSIAIGLGNGWSATNMFYNDTSQKLYRAFFVNNRWWTFATRLFRNPPTNFGGTWGARNYNDQLGQDNHYQLTLASTNLYDAADGSLMPDFALDGVFTSGQSVNSSGDGSGSVAENVNGSVFEIRAQGNFYVGDRVNWNGQLTEYGPSPSEIVFTSQNAGTTPVSATDATVSFRKWTLETRASSSDPWTVVTESDDYDIVAGQDGSTPWASSPTLQPNTLYRVKVSYYSDNAEPVESVYSTFETGPA